MYSLDKEYNLVFKDNSGNEVTIKEDIIDEIKYDELVSFPEGTKLKEDIMEVQFYKIIFPDESILKVFKDPVNCQFKGYNKERPFMKTVKSLGNILGDNGYNLELIQGSSKEFGALDLYALDNGNYKVFDDNTAKEKGLVPSNYFEWWGIEDKKLLEFSKDEILQLSEKNAPFAVLLFTMDTHFKDGYLDKSCEVKYSEPLANSYACSSKMVSNYLEWLKEQEFYSDTTIILLGDHQVMQDSFYKDHRDYERVNYNVFINSSINKSMKNRKFSQYDMYPTILASIGAKIEGNKLGFGVDLFSGEKTLIELLGKDKFNSELLKSSEYYDKYIYMN